ncbi:hypothetical protein MRX96_027430 [Rhipicephalus microplus]
MRVLSADGFGSPKKRLVLSTCRRATFHLWIVTSDAAANPGSPSGVGQLGSIGASFESKHEVEPTAYGFRLREP